MVAQLVDPRGYFSVLRYRSDSTRDEARNVAILLVGRDGQFGGLMAAPVSAISPRLQQQGIVDAILQSLRNRFSRTDRPDVTVLTALHEELERSLYLTKPEPVVVPDVDATLSALYKAYVAPTGGARDRAAKGAILDRVVTMYRREGRQLRRGSYVGDFLFDLVFDDEPVVGEVLSFATQRRKYEEVENDAAHFLYGLSRVGGLNGLAIIQPPTSESPQSASESHSRVRGWLEAEDITVDETSELLHQRHEQVQQPIAW